MSEFDYHPIFSKMADDTSYRKLEGSEKLVKIVQIDDKEYLKIEPEAIRKLAEVAWHDISHYLRPSHLAQLKKILEDPEASSGDRKVATELLLNADIASEGILPMCQDTGTAIALGKKGQYVLTDFDDEAPIAEGAKDAWSKNNLRYSQNAPLNMFDEVNTGDNLPAQIDLMATQGSDYKFLFMAKGGGSANKTYLFQETRALLNPESFEKFVRNNILKLGTSACPPYHLAVVIGGTSAEQNLKTVKLASARYYDNLPKEGNKYGQAYRDVEWEEKILKWAQETKIGAQFGGKYFCHDVRVIRLPRHGASCPVGLGVSCSADRQILGKITKDGVFVEQLEFEPQKYMPKMSEKDETIAVDLNRPMAEVLAQLSGHPVGTMFALNGTIIVGRDIAHAKLKEKLDKGEDLPEYVQNHPIYYAGPAKTPKGYASGSFGPTTAGRMDSYVDLFQAHNGSKIMIAKGNRSQQVVDACKKHGGFYLASIGGPAARLAKDCIKKVELLEYPELGMEAIWKIEVKDFPAMTIIDDKGNDFFADLI
ncbi:MAG: fumarate hydratase [Alphaproteobacteria bacterium]